MDDKNHFDKGEKMKSEIKIKSVKKYLRENLIRFIVENKIEKPNEMTRSMEKLNQHMIEMMDMGLVDDVVKTLDDIVEGRRS